ncbi:hypothetical protein Pfo_012866 [Paulownia fortunei]|nr:hypothetical protein Pfo_012866 [Paulownia fortunei]
MANRKNNEEQSNRPACAACKYQRKKCMADCILRRHFPADRAEDFKAVHKIFGIANVTKMMREVNSEDQDKIAKSLFWEATMWVQDPVRGPYGCFMRLQDELQVLREFINKQQLLQDMAVPTTPVINGFLPCQNNITTTFHGNMMNANSNGYGNSIMESDVNSNNTLVEESQERGGGLPYPFRPVGAVSQRMWVQELEPRFFQQGNRRPFLFPVVRHVQRIGGEQENNCVSGHQSIRNRQWSGWQVKENSGSSVSAHFLGSESNRARRNGSKEATHQELDVTEAL